jgi:nitroreductase
MKAEVLNTIIRERRSVFPQQYSGARVDDEIVKQILESANLAPTHRLTQPWRFIVYTDNGLLALAKAQAEIYKRVTQTDATFKEERYQNLLTKPMQSSHIIVVCMKRDEKKSVPEIEEIGAVFCAVENMYLTATAYGVGCYLSTGGVTYFEEAKEIFGLGKEDKLIGFFHLGMPTRVPSPAKRKSLDEVVSWVEV